MRQIYYLLNFVVAAMLLSSCSKEDRAVGEKPHLASITINLPTSIVQSRALVADTPEEQIINSLTLFIVSGGVFEKTMTFDPNAATTGDKYSWDNLTSTLTLSELNELDKNRTIYAVANWAVPAAVTDEATLNNAITEITAPIAAPSKSAPLLLSGKTDHNFATSLRSTVQLKRQAAKISLLLTFTDDFADAVSSYNFAPVGNAAVVEAVNTPSQSYVIDRNVMPHPVNMLASANVEGKIEKDAVTNVPKFMATLYVYENTMFGNAPSVAALSTFLIVNLPYQKDGASAVVSSNLYKIEIKNSADAISPYKTHRNTFYQISGTIKGFGVPTIVRAMPIVPVDTRVTQRL